MQEQRKNLWNFMRYGIPMAKEPNPNRESVKFDLGNEIAEVFIREDKVLYTPKTEQAVQQPVQAQERRGFASAICYPRGSAHIATGELMYMEEVENRLDEIVNGASR